MNIDLVRNQLGLFAYSLLFHFLWEQTKWKCPTFKYFTLPYWR